MLIVVADVFRLRKQPTEAQVILRGMDCILLLLSMWVAAWNNTAADSSVLYHTTAGVKRKKDAKGSAGGKNVSCTACQCSCLQRPTD